MYTGTNGTCCTNHGITNIMPTLQNIKLASILRWFKILKFGDIYLLKIENSEELKIPKN